MHNATVHILKVTEGYGSDKVFAPVLTHTLVKNNATAYCMVSGVDARLLTTLSSSLPPAMSCVFRPSGEKRLSLAFLVFVFVGAIACVMGIGALAYYSLTAVFLFSTGPVFLGTPLTYPVSLCVAWYCTLLLTNTAVGKRWAFALENGIGFCCNDESLSYWCQMKVKACKRGYASRTRFSVMALRERASGASIRIVIFRASDDKEMHAPLLCDAIDLARPKKYRFSVASVIVCVPKKPMDAAHVHSLRELLQKSTFSTHVTPEGCIVAGISHCEMPVTFETYLEQGLDSAVVVHLPLVETSATLWWKPEKRPRHTHYWNVV